MNEEKILEALKKSVAMPPVLRMNEVSPLFIEYADGHAECKVQANNWFRCPICENIVGERKAIRGRIYDQKKKKYCDNCGQRINWEKDVKDEKVIEVGSPNTEFVIMAKRITNGKYTTIGRTFENELLCRRRFEEMIRNRIIIQDVDLSSAVIARRKTMTLTEEWEAFGNINLGI